MRWEYAQSVIPQGEEEEFLAKRGLEGWELTCMVPVGMPDERAKLNHGGRLIGVQQAVKAGWLLIFKRVLNDPDPCECHDASLSDQRISEAG